MSAARKRLPARRAYEAISFVHGGFAYTAGVSRLADGRLAQVFLDANAKSGTVVEAWSRDTAIVASLVLQHGVDTETLRKALTRDELGRAAGPVGALLDILAGDAP